jgi:hypothetical protein
MRVILSFENNEQGIAFALVGPDQDPFHHHIHFLVKGLGCNMESRAIMAKPEDKSKQVSTSTLSKIWRVVKPMFVKPLVKVNQPHFANQSSHFF